MESSASQMEKGSVEQLVNKFRAGAAISEADLASVPLDTFVRASEDTYKRRILTLFLHLSRSPGGTGRLSVCP